MTERITVTQLKKIRIFVDSALKKLICHEVILHFLPMTKAKPLGSS